MPDDGMGGGAVAAAAPGDRPRRPRPVLRWPVEVETSMRASVTARRDDISKMMFPEPPPIQRWRWRRGRTVTGRLPPSPTRARSLRSRRLSSRARACLSPAAAYARRLTSQPITGEGGGAGPEADRAGTEPTGAGGGAPRARPVAVGRSQADAELDILAAARWPVRLTREGPGTSTCRRRVHPPATACAPRREPWSPVTCAGAVRPDLFGFGIVWGMSARPPRRRRHAPRWWPAAGLAGVASLSPSSTAAAPGREIEQTRRARPALPVASRA
jgi:hypothetical protein